MFRFLGATALFAALALLVSDASFGQDGKDKKKFGNPEEMFKKLDTNSDGKLSKEEFLKFTEKIDDADKRAKATEFLGKIYDKLNTGGSGLTLDQYKKFSEMRKDFKKKDAN